MSPPDARAFSDAVIREEGLDPELLDRDLYRRVVATVARLVLPE